MRQINHSVTVLRVCREEWLKAVKNRYVLCSHAIPYEKYPTMARVKCTCMK